MKNILVLLFLATSLLNAQNIENAFNAGEKLTFTASYNMSGFLTDLAEVTMHSEAIPIVLKQINTIANCTFDDHFKHKKVYKPDMYNYRLYTRNMEISDLYRLLYKHIIMQY